MFKKIALILLVITNFVAFPQYKVKVVDFLKEIGSEVNSAGAIIIKSDEVHNRVICVNTLTSTVSIIDGKTNKVTNIPVGARGFQHLKNEALTFSKKTGMIYFIGTKSFSIVEPQTKTSKTIPTEVQFESIAVDENTGNVFIAGRESAELGFYDAKQEKFSLIKWLEHKEKLMNLNQTPPPPIRKVVSANELNQIIAIDGYTSTLYLFNSSDGKLIKSRQLKLTKEGRWHLAGYNEKTHFIYLVTETSKRQVLEAGQIDITGENDLIFKLPEGYTEPVGICYNPKYEQV